jgi:hypothetical protein
LPAQPATHGSWCYSCAWLLLLLLLLWPTTQGALLFALRSLLQSWWLCCDNGLPCRHVATVRSRAGSTCVLG